MPIRSSRRERLLPRRITPIEPVMEPGLATILSAARQQLELLSDRLLANPVIEDWTLELKDDSSAGA